MHGDRVAEARIAEIIKARELGERNRKRGGVTRDEQTETPSSLGRIGPRTRRATNPVRAVHPCISRAKEQHSKDSASPMWRENWNFRVLQGRKLIFRGSYDACVIATGACNPLQPWRVVSSSGEEQIANR